MNNPVLNPNFDFSYLLEKAAMGSNNLDDLRDIVFNYLMANDLVKQRFGSLQEFAQLKAKIKGSIFSFIFYCGETGKKGTTLNNYMEYIAVDNFSLLEEKEMDELTINSLRTLLKIKFHKGIN